MAVGVLATKREHHSDLVDRDYVFFQEVDSSKPPVQPPGAVRWHYVGDVDDMPDGYDDLAVRWEAGDDLSDAAMYQLADIHVARWDLRPESSVWTAYPQEWAAAPMTMAEDTVTGALAPTPITTAKLDLLPLDEVTFTTRLSAAYGDAMRRINDLAWMRYSWVTKGVRKKAQEIYELVILQVTDLAMLAMAIHRGVYTRWQGGRKTTPADAMILLRQIERERERIEWRFNRLFRSGATWRSLQDDWLDTDGRRMVSDVVTAMGEHLSEPTLRAMPHLGPDDALRAIPLSFDPSRAAQTWRLPRVQNDGNTLG